MDKRAIGQAWERLHQAQNAHKALLMSTSFAQTETAWLQFLNNAAKIYSKLGKGSKGSGSSEGWFGRVKHERRTDPLLSYVHHARNADEHGIEPITERDKGFLSIRGDVLIEHLTTDDDGVLSSLKARSLNPLKPIEVKHRPGGVRLVTVVDDLHNDSFTVPTHHLGKLLESQSLEHVATLTLTYLTRLIEDGAKYIKQA